MPRYLCDVLQDMRDQLETMNFANFKALIEEAQHLANRMESALSYSRNLNELRDERDKVKDEVKELRKKRDESKTALEEVQTIIKDRMDPPKNKCIKEGCNESRSHFCQKCNEKVYKDKFLKQQ